MKKLKLKKAFTLIELLIVISIIIIIAGVIIANTNTGRDKARRSKAQQMARSMMPYLSQCNASGSIITNPANNGPSCLNSPVYPNLTSTSCTWGTINSNQFTVTCAAGNILCNINTGSCT